MADVVGGDCRGEISRGLEVGFADHGLRGVGLAPFLELRLEGGGEGGEIPDNAASGTLPPRRSLCWDYSVGPL